MLYITIQVQTDTDITVWCFHFHFHFFPFVLMIFYFVFYFEGHSGWQHDVSMSRSEAAVRLQKLWHVTSNSFMKRKHRPVSECVLSSVIPEQPVPLKREIQSWIHRNVWIYYKLKSVFIRQIHYSLNFSQSVFLSCEAEKHLQFYKTFMKHCRRIKDDKIFNL